MYNISDRIEDEHKQVVDININENGSGKISQNTRGEYADLRRVATCTLSSKSSSNS